MVALSYFSRHSKFATHSLGNTDLNHLKKIWILNLGKFDQGPSTDSNLYWCQINIYSSSSDVKWVKSCVVWLKISQTSLKSLIGVHLYCSWKYFFFQYQLQRQNRGYDPSWVWQILNLEFVEKLTVSFWSNFVRIYQNPS